MFLMQLRRATHKATQIIHSSRNIWTCAIAEIQQLPNHSGIIKLLRVQRRGVHGHIRGPCRERGPDSTAVRHTKLVKQVNAKLPLSKQRYIESKFSIGARSHTKKFNTADGLGFIIWMVLYSFHALASKSWGLRWS